MSSGRGQINDAHLISLNQVDDFKCGHMTLATEPAPALGLGTPDPIVSVKELRLICMTADWQYVRAEDAVEAAGIDGNDWADVPAEVEEIIPVDMAHEKVFVRSTVDGSILKWKIYGFISHSEP